MQKVIVIGCSGSGKSIFSKALLWSGCTKLWKKKLMNLWSLLRITTL